MKLALNHFFSILILVAGVANAHEIDDPVGSCNGDLKSAADLLVPEQYFPMVLAIDRPSDGAARSSQHWRVNSYLGDPVEIRLYDTSEIDFSARTHEPPPVIKVIQGKVIAQSQIGQTGDALSFAKFKIELSDGEIQEIKENEVEVIGIRRIYPTNQVRNWLDPNQVLGHRVYVVSKTAQEVKTISKDGIEFVVKETVDAHWEGIVSHVEARSLILDTGAKIPLQLIRHHRISVMKMVDHQNIPYEWEHVFRAKPTARVIGLDGKFFYAHHELDQNKINFEHGFGFDWYRYRGQNVTLSTLKSESGSLKVDSDVNQVVLNRAMLRPEINLGIERLSEFTDGALWMVSSENGTRLSAPFFENPETHTFTVSEMEKPLKHLLENVNLLKEVKVGLIHVRGYSGQAIMGEELRGGMMILQEIVSRMFGIKQPQELDLYMVPAESARDLVFASQIRNPTIQN